MKDKIKNYTIVDAYKSVMKTYEMLRKPGIVFTEEQKKKIADFVEKKRKKCSEK